jgi:signal peptidase II
VKAKASARLSDALIWIVAIVVVALDQWAKFWAIRALADGEVRTLWPRMLDLIFVRNAHGAYGLFGDRPWFLIGLSLVAFLVIFFSFRTRARASRSIAFALGAVLGGAAGNVIDRIHYHYVIDFVRIIPLPIFEVFNLADAAISLGIVFIILASLTRKESLPQP